MQIKKCHFCNTDIYPEEQRYRVTIRIYPDLDEEYLSEDPCSEEIICQEECHRNACTQEEIDDEEFIQEAQLIICKNCQNQFSENPFMKESLLFIGNETHQKTVH